MKPIRSNFGGLGDRANQPPMKLIPPHPSKHLYDSSPQIKQLMRMVQELKVENQCLEEEVLILQVETEEVEYYAADLQAKCDRQKETIYELQQANQELLERTANSGGFEPLSPCLKCPGTPKKSFKVNFSTELVRVIPIDREESPSKLPVHKESIVSLDDPGIDDSRIMMRNLVRSYSFSELSTRRIKT